MLVHTGRDAFVRRARATWRSARRSPPRPRCWLYERGVRVMGIDAWGWDGPLDLQAAGGARARRARDLLGRPPVRPPVLADRAAREPGRAAADRLPGGVLPAARSWARARRRARGRVLPTSRSRELGQRPEVVPLVVGHGSGPGAGSRVAVDPRGADAERCAGPMSYLKPNATCRISLGAARRYLAARSSKCGVGRLVGRDVLGDGRRRRSATSICLSECSMMSRSVFETIHQPQARLAAPRAGPGRCRGTAATSASSARAPCRPRRRSGSRARGQRAQALGEDVAVGPVVALDHLELDRLPALAQLAAGRRVGARGAQRVVDRGTSPGRPPSRSACRSSRRCRRPFEASMPAYT